MMPVGWFPEIKPKPFTSPDIDAQAARGKDVTGLVPYDPLPLTLKSRLVEKGAYSWHVPVVVKCCAPFTRTPSPDQLFKEITSFITCKGDGVEIVKEPVGKKQRAR